MEAKIAREITNIYCTKLMDNLKRDIINTISIAAHEGYDCVRFIHPKASTVKPHLINWLHDLGYQLVGIDYPEDAYVRNILLDQLSHHELRIKW